MMTLARAASCPEGYASIFATDRALVDLRSFAPETAAKVQEVFAHHAAELRKGLSTEEARQLDDIIRNPREAESLRNNGVAHYKPDERVIEHSPLIRQSWLSLIALIHEGRHAADYAQGFKGLRRLNPLWSQTRFLESRAFTAQQRFMRDLYAKLSVEEISSLAERALDLPAAEAAAYRERIARGKGLTTEAATYASQTNDAARASLEQRLEKAAEHNVPKQLERIALSERNYRRLQLSQGYQETINEEHVLHLGIYVPIVLGAWWIADTARKSSASAPEPPTSPSQPVVAPSL